LFTLPGLELPPLLVVQPVASRYTDSVIPAPAMESSTEISGWKIVANGFTVSRATPLSTKLIKNMYTSYRF
jgi:hypothetical protein